MSLPERGGWHFQPCWKCDYLFNHISGKVSRGTGWKTPVLKKINTEQRKDGYESVDL